MAYPYTIGPQQIRQAVLNELGIDARTLANGPTGAQIDAAVTALRAKGQGSADFALNTMLGLAVNANATTVQDEVRKIFCVPRSGSPSVNKDSVTGDELPWVQGLRLALGVNSGTDLATCLTLAASRIT